MKTLIFLILTIITMSTGTNDFKKELVELRWTVLPKKTSKKIFDQCSRTTPKHSRIIELEESIYHSAIEKLVSKKDSLMNKAGVKLENYTFQLVGFSHKTKKYIYINANITDMEFEHERKWKENPIVWCDGNESSWGIVYDLSNDSLKDFITNGPKVTKIDEV